MTRKTGGSAKWTGAIALDEIALAVPASWKKPRNVFFNSMSDLFHPDVPVDFIHKVWNVKTPSLVRDVSLFTLARETM